MSGGRTLQIARVLGATAAALGLLWIAGSRLVPTVTEEGTLPPPGRVDSPSEPSVGIAVSSGMEFGARWTLGVEASKRDICVRLVYAETTTSSCGYDGRSLQVARASAGSGRTLLFGSLPGGAAKIWMKLQDGRTVSGRLFPVPGSIGTFDLYLLPLEDVHPGEVVAVNRSGSLVDSSHFSTTGEAGRPVGVVDSYGNVIGYVPIGGWGLPPPGRPAPLQDVRVYLMAPLTPARPEFEDWWTSRPPQKIDSDALKMWWANYPVRRLLTRD